MYKERLQTVNSIEKLVTVVKKSKINVCSDYIHIAKPGYNYLKKIFPLLVKFIDKAILIDVKMH